MRRTKAKLELKFKNAQYKIVLLNQFTVTTPIIRIKNCMEAELEAVATTQLSEGAILHHLAAEKNHSIPRPEMNHGSQNRTVLHLLGWFNPAAFRRSRRNERLSCSSTHTTF